MNGDLKEIVGPLMRALNGERISCADVEDLAFEAEGELQIALNEAYVTLLEFAYDCDAHGSHPLSDEMQAALQRSIDEIVRCSDFPDRSPGGSRDPSVRARSR